MKLLIQASCISCIFLLLASCTGKRKEKSINEEPISDSFTAISGDSNTDHNSFEENSIEESTVIPELQFNRTKIKLGHAVNTSADEYLPVLNREANVLFFSGMDRTGYFDFKLDFIKQKSSGGEDVFYSRLEDGIWSDARPLESINTNGHEVVSQVINNGDLLVTANYPEKLGPDYRGDAGVQTTDLFYLKSQNKGFQIIHFPEPVNSIYTEADAWMSEDGSYMLFVSDRPGHVGEYHKKGWKWNESFWGNTDVYVTFKRGDAWSVPENLGANINSFGAERTPWLSDDGLTLYLSSNGYLDNKTDLDVYAFKRSNLKDWKNWEGPFNIVDVNTPFDDWGYKEYANGTAYVASATPLDFVPTQLGRVGDGGVRQTNLRPGYELFGLQTAALNASNTTNIFALKKRETPTFIIEDVFFDFDAANIKKSFENQLLLMVDQIGENPDLTLDIMGHTDNVGDAEYNQELSLRRAKSVALFLRENGVVQEIVTRGFGDSKPLLPNTDKNSRSRNRRVEVFLK